MVTTVQPDPPTVSSGWENVGDMCQRIQVPGGYIYRTWLESYNDTMRQNLPTMLACAFVPST